MRRRFIYMHDGHEVGLHCWLELETGWDETRKCYVLTVRTNDATDHGRLETFLPSLYAHNKTFREEKL